MTIRLYNPATHTVVPREPTPEMLNKLFVLPEFVGTVIVRHSVDKLPDAYAAMLVAAPDASRPLPTRERLAVEIYNSHCPQTDIVWYLLPDKDKNIYRRIADAVLALLAEREKGE